MPSIKVYPDLSPRVIEVLAPATSITVQELYDLIRDWEDEWMQYPILATGTGKTSLGGGSFVGITLTLRNAQVMFTGRTTPVTSGSATANNAAGIQLTNSGASFVTNGISRGYTVVNETTRDMAVITSVPSQTVLNSFPLTGVTPSHGSWAIGNQYTIYPSVICSITGGNLVGVDTNNDYLIPILPSPNVSIFAASSSSATLTEVSGSLNVEQIADAVWDALVSDHNIANTFGERVRKAVFNSGNLA